MRIQTLVKDIDLSLFDKMEIESEIIKIFLSQNNIRVKDIKNSFLKQLIDANENEKLKDFLISIKETWSLKDIENLFYSLYENNEKQSKGIVFTPNYIIDYILQNTVDLYNSPTICDFSCGCGAFLIRAIERLYQKDKSIDLINIVEEKIFGIDVLEDNVRRTKILLSLLLLKYGQDKEHITFNIYCYDSTKRDVLSVFSNEKILNGFDCIIGNPPYIKIQDMDLETRNYLTSSYTTCTKGSFNIYFSFIELGMKYLKDTGKLGYIVPNYFLKMHSAQPLREYLIKNTYISSVIDFKDNLLFDGIQTYTAIIILDKKPKNEFSYAIIKDLKDRNLSQLDLEMNKLRYKDVNPETINLLNSVEKENIYKIENAGVRLKISTGIATQKDALYILGLNNQDILDDSQEFYYKEYKGKLYPIEKSITKKIIKGGSNIDFEEGKPKKHTKIIYPYQKIGNKIMVIPEDQMSLLYPNTLRYLEAVKDELAKRNSGNPQVSVWYEYGRSQALDCFGPKIIFPTNSNKPKFVLFEDEALFNNGYAIYDTPQLSLFNNNSLNLKVLLKILNSFVMDYYIKLTSYMISGGYYCYQKKYIQNFSIPEFSEEELNFLINCNEKEKLDEFLIKKYDLRL
ncbi:MAG: SAM-dependent methyltransferase [Anoxybacillus sp.]|nr:N-6 DNA methylase [Anoxybacillus sp.]MCL6585561.1 SAM-dependent methyltransferase [Anoxybacillus sp.]